MITQDTLAAEFAERVARVGTAGHGPARQVVVVLRDADPAVFAASAIAFAHGLAEPAGAAWYRGFTKTIFLAGDPHNLAGRHPADHLAADGSIGWYGPAPVRATEGLRRMLRPFQGPAGIAPGTVRVPLPGPGGDAGLDVAVTGMTVQDYLVAVHHVLCEAALDGLLTDAGGLVVRHLDGPPGGRYDRIRVVAEEPGGPLRAVAGLAVFAFSGG